MGCVSSTFLNQDDEFSQIGGAAFSHHIVSLTSTTYGLLTMDPPTPVQPPPPPRVTLGSLFPSPLSEPRSLRYQPLETINARDLMSGLDSDHISSFRFSISPLLASKVSSSPVKDRAVVVRNENASPNVAKGLKNSLLEKFEMISPPNSLKNLLLEKFELICPPNGEDKVVMYSTSLRGVRKTFEDCNAVRSAVEGLGYVICERDISMDKGFRDELKELMKEKENTECIPPRLFVKGRYVGGVDEVMMLLEEGSLSELLEGLPKMKGGCVCDGCGGVRFLPCFTCNGSCKIVMVLKEGNGTAVMRCSDCNENGLVLCPICS